MTFIITEDLNEDCQEGVTDVTGVIGPLHANEDYMKALRHGDGLVFRLMGESGNVVYKGRLIGANEFQPLYAFGAPFAGCVSIQFLFRGHWLEPKEFDPSMFAPRSRNLLVES